MGQHYSCQQLSLLPWLRSHVCAKHDLQCAFARTFPASSSSAWSAALLSWQARENVNLYRGLSAEAHSMNLNSVDINQSVSSNVERSMSLHSRTIRYCSYA